VARAEVEGSEAVGVAATVAEGGRETAEGAVGLGARAAVEAAGAAAVAARGTTATGRLAEDTRAGAPHRLGDLSRFARE